MENIWSIYVMMYTMKYPILFLKSLPCTFKGFFFAVKVLQTRL